MGVLMIEIFAAKIIFLSECRFMIRNPQVRDDLRELQGCIHAFSDHKAVLATR